VLSVGGAAYTGLANVSQQQGVPDIRDPARLAQRKDPYDSWSQVHLHAA